MFTLPGRIRVFPLVFATFLTSTAILFAKPVNLEMARRAAMAHYRTVAPFNPLNSILSALSFPLVYEQRAAISSADTQTVYYLFNTSDGHGFVVVAGDDAVDPVLAYSTEGSISMDRPSPEFVWWMKHYERQIVDAVQRHQAGSQSTQRAWKLLATASPSLPVPTIASSASAGPLLSTQWDQSPYYNALCPFDYAKNERALTGCVATAFAQIMMYHRVPEHGTGDHGYSHPQYGYLYANFANATYDWNAMPNRVTSRNDQVAKLMYHVGVSCDMEYGTEASGAFPKDAAAALVKYFGYQSSARNVERREYDDNAWTSMIRGELDQARPVEYHGFGDGGGHSFVCDGYNGSYFHMNWGWDGHYNGFFLLSSLVPEGVGAGGGSGSYNRDQGAVIGIIPEHPAPGAASIEMYASLTVNPNPVTANGIVTVGFDVHNTGNATFRGDYCVALFDTGGAFVKYLGVWDDFQLAANYHYTNGLTSIDTLFGVYPGTYYIYAYSRPTDEEWVPVTAGAFRNGVILQVTKASYPSMLSIYAKPTTSPEQIRAGEAFTLHTDVANFGASDFHGDIGIWAYTTDGRASLGEVNVTQDLDLGANKHYTNGLTFSCNALNVAPGRYMLAFFNRNQGEDWELIGPGDYVNPLIIDVLPSLLVADKYEQNDAPGEAYPLTLTYAGNVGRATTAGSNIHASGNDDYYRIDLPAGREYDISAALHDSWTDEAGGFTNDVSVMVNPGDGWSDVYDDSTDVIHVTGGRSVIFKVQSLYLGTLGTYQLDVRAARSTSGVDEPAAPTKLDLTVYPLPASSELHVRLDSRFGRLLRLHLVDAVGRTVAERAVDEKDVFDFKLDGVASGAYMLVAETGHGEVVRRVVVRR